MASLDGEGIGSKLSLWAWENQIWWNEKKNKEEEVNINKTKHRILL